MPLPNIDCPAPLGRTLLSSQRSWPGLRLRPRVTPHQQAGPGVHTRSGPSRGLRPRARPGWAAAGFDPCKDIFQMAPKMTSGKLTPNREFAARYTGHGALPGEPRAVVGRESIKWTHAL